MPVWLRLSIAAAATLLVGMGLGRFSYSPMIPALIDVGALSEAQAGIIGSANFTGYLFGALAAPLMRRRWGETATLRISLIAALAALVASVLPWGFTWLIFWRGLVGAAVGVMMIYCLALATRHAPPGKLGAATGIAYTGVGAGILLSATLIPWLLEHGLAAAWTGVAVLGALGVAVGFWGWRPPKNGASAAASNSNDRSDSKVEWTRPVVGLICARVFFTVGLIPHTIYWVDYLVRGLDRGMAFGGAHWALFGLGALCGTYLWGRLADWLGFRTGLALAFAAVAVGTALPVLSTAGWALVLSSLVVGAQPGLTAILSGRVHQVAGPARMAGAWRMSALIATVCQAIAGYFYVSLFAITASYTPIFLLGGFSMAMGAVVTLALVKDPAVLRPARR